MSFWYTVLLKSLVSSFIFCCYNPYFFQVFVTILAKFIQKIIVYFCRRSSILKDLFNFSCPAYRDLFVILFYSKYMRSMILINSL